MAGKFVPFADGASSLGLGELTIEDAGDTVSFYGTLNVEATKDGLATAKRLADVVNAMVAKLEGMDLPDALPTAKLTTEPNPFG